MFNMKESQKEVKLLEVPALTEQEIFSRTNTNKSDDDSNSESI